LSSQKHARDPKCPLCGVRLDRFVLDQEGVPVLIRGACPDDKDKLVAFYERLSNETIYTRFFSIVRYFEPYVERILNGPAYVIVAEREDTGEIIAVAEAVPNSDGTAAEAGIVVLEKYQGRGIGKRIAYALSRVLWERGVRRVVGYILPGNIKAYRLVKKLGGRIKSYYESLLYVEIPVRPGPANGKTGEPAGTGS